MRGLIHDPLWRAWALLLALGAATTLAAAAGGRLAAPMLGAVILGLAGAKARLILARYLGLADAPVWLRGFS
ncbi:MAG: cytochrome C oxidase subunit IV family protein, partial [Thermohalobaculum sp.]|nr:cytochrome C oxidase subunit IV family protein [Thermohalobaculum sp.]